MSETPFKIAIGVLLILMGIGRRIFAGNYFRIRRKTVRRETGFLFIWIVFSPAYVSLFLYLLTSRLDPFHVPMPVWLRCVGALIFLVGDLLTLWAHQALGKLWSPVLEIREEHRLVTSGPYRYVRHPIYASFLVICAGLALLSANWLIAVTWFAGAAIIFRRRISAEEEMMIEEFGDEYRDYMTKTGRLLPRLPK